MNSFDAGLALATVQMVLLGDKQADGARILRDCPVVVLAERYPGRGKHNDRISLVHRDGWARWWLGNTQPGRTGLNKAIGKFYAELIEGIHVEVKGRHSIRPNRFRQPSKSQAELLGLRRYFTDGRANGWCTVNRLRDDGSIAKTETGYFAINLHDSSETGVGSAGCVTLPWSRYEPFRDLAYAAMTEARQEWLPMIVTGPV